MLLYVIMSYVMCVCRIFLIKGYLLTYLYTNCVRYISLLKLFALEPTMLEMRPNIGAGWEKNI